MAHYFVGDIQGCYDELMRLLDDVQFDPANDKLCPVGDLVARGPDSDKVAQLMLTLADSVQTVLGNHDLHLLAIYAGFHKPKKNDKLLTLLASSHIDAYINWLRQQPLIRQFPEFNIVMSHAGLHPDLSLEQQLQLAQAAEQKLSSANYKVWLEKMYGNDPKVWRTHLTDVEQFRFIVNVTTRMRFINDDGALEFKTKVAPEDAPLNLSPWFKIPPRINNTMVFGHWASLLGNTGHKQFIALDTGCVWGNKLTMYRPEDGRFFSQACLS